jgi:hypothetical protein
MMQISKYNIKTVKYNIKTFEHRCAVIDKDTDKPVATHFISAIKVFQRI